MNGGLMTSYSADLSSFADPQPQVDFALGWLVSDA